MKKTLLQLLVATAVVVSVVGCSSYNQLVKSGDNEKMYNAALEYYNAGKYTKALQLFQEIAHVYQGTLKEDTITFYSGSALYKQGDFETSGMIFDDFRHRFGRSPFIEDAEYLYAMGYYFASPEPERDQTLTITAISAIAEYLERYPNSIKKELCNERIGELQYKLYQKEYLNAKTYYKIGYYKSAITALKNSLDKYPQTPLREETVYLLVSSGYELARNSVAELQKDRYLDMMDSYYTFVGEYPESSHIRDVERMGKAAKAFLSDKNPTTDDQQ